MTLDAGSISYGWVGSETSTQYVTLTLFVINKDIESAIVFVRWRKWTKVILTIIQGGWSALISLYALTDSTQTISEFLQ